MRDTAPAGNNVAPADGSQLAHHVSRELFRFAEFELDPANCVLRRGGTIVKLGPQALKALTLLVRRAGDLVTREELRRAIWDDQTNVDYEHGLNTCIRQVRAALGDAGVELIETAPRLGYRFTAPVERVGPAPAAPAVTRWRVQRSAVAAILLIATLTTAVVSRNCTRADPSLARIRLAVLPLPAGEAQTDLWTRGLAEDLMTRLDTVEGVQVIAETSAFSFRNTTTPLREIGARLAADVVVTLSVRRSAGAFDVDARLVGLPDEREIWSEHFTHADHEVFATQAEITRRLASVLRRRLAEGENRWPTEDPEAYELYLRGRAAAERGGEPNARLALQLFNQAIARDPAFAHAYAAVAAMNFRFQASLAGVAFEQAYERAKEAAQRALTLDPSLPEAHVAAARLKSAVHDWQGAEREYQRAIELAPNRSVAREQYATWLSLHGRFTEAIAEADQALLLDPLSPRTHYTAGLVRRFARQCHEAVTHLEKALGLDPQYGPAHHEMAQCYEMSGRLDAAIEAYRRGAQSAGNLGHALAVAGRTAEARTLLTRLIERHRQTGTGTGQIAQIYIGLGEPERALDWLDKMSDSSGMPQTLKVAAVWDPLRSHPRFTELLRRSGLALDQGVRRADARPGAQ